MANLRPISSMGRELLAWSRTDDSAVYVKGSNLKKMY